jgi:iron-sulfur cluster assembly accessory protein
MPASESPPVTPLNNASPAASTNQLTVTDSCMKRIESLAEKRNESLDEVYLRVYVDAGGCSGFQYKFEMTRDADEAVGEEDVIFYSSPLLSSSSGGCARVVVDASSLELIHGSTIDFVQDMMKSAFSVVENPQSESACGCGSSFAVKNFSANPAMD